MLPTAVRAARAMPTPLSHATLGKEIRHWQQRIVHNLRQGIAPRTLLGRHLGFRLFSKVAPPRAISVGPAAWSRSGEFFSRRRSLVDSERLQQRYALQGESLWRSPLDAHLCVDRREDRFVLQGRSFPAPRRPYRRALCVSSCLPSLITLRHLRKAHVMSYAGASGHASTPMSSPIYLSPRDSASLADFDVVALWKCRVA